MELNHTKKLLSVILILWFDGVLAQFESEPVSVALDNTGYQCFVDGFRPNTSSSTKGGSSLRSFSTGDGNLPQGGCFIEGNKTVTFDWRLDLPNQSIGDEFYLQANGQFGELYRLATLSSSTNWTTVRVYLPSGVDQINWVLVGASGGAVAWIDNLRVQDGNQTVGSSGGSGRTDGPFIDNPLSVALDNTFYEFGTGADANFFVTSSASTTGNTSLQSGNITDNQQSILLTYVPPNQPISFDWRVSSEQGFDFLVFYFLDSATNIVGQPEFISGSTNWETMELTSPPNEEGVFAVWSYVKDESLSAGVDAGWVDNVQIGRNGLPVLGGILNLLLDDE